MSALLERRLSLAELAPIEAHLDICPSCRSWLAEATRLWFPTEDTQPVEPLTIAALRPSAIERGALLGRYLVLERFAPLSVGFLAYDPKLDRKVALKMLNTEFAADDGEALLLEVRALARLSHPNVLLVHDVGADVERRFVAFEYVEGQTVATWLTTKPPWREILKVFVQAGTGLLAAHAAGIIHHDFKAEHVLLGGDGRVRVTDFGRVRPVFSAPELASGQAADARSDQFSFCAALFGALYGIEPFAAAAAHELAPAPSGSTVPLWVWSVLQRGLSPVPEARYPSMEPLLGALQPRPARWRRRLLAAAVALAAVGAFAAPGVLARHDVSQCVEANTPARPPWAPVRRIEVRRALSQTGVSFVGATLARLEPQLDALAEGVTTQRRQACEAALLRGELSTEVLSRRLACLGRIEHQLSALSGLFERADGELVSKAIEAASAVGHPEACAELAEPEAARAPQLSRRVEATREKLAEAVIFEAAGHLEQAFEVASRALAEAGPLQVRGVEAEAELTVAKLEARRGHDEAAVAAGRRALWAAQVEGAPALAVAATTALVELLGLRQPRADESAEMAHLAEAYLERCNHDPALTAGLARARALVARRTRRWGDAQTFDRQALELRDRLLPPQPLAKVQSLLDLSQDLRGQGQLREALELSLRAEALSEKALGPADPQRLLSIEAVGALLVAIDQPEEAVARLREALALCQEALPPRHPQIAHAQISLGAALVAARAPAEGLPLIREAIASLRAAGNSESLRQALASASTSARLAQEPAAAADWAREALALTLTLPSTPPTELGLAHALVGKALLARGQTVEGLTELKGALAQLEPVFGPDDVELADPLACVGRGLLTLGSPGAAVLPLDRAVLLLERGPASPATVAEVQLELARALWDSRVDRPRALELVAKVLQAQEPMSARHQELCSEAGKWRDAHR